MREEAEQGLTAYLRDQLPDVLRSFENSDLSELELDGADVHLRLLRPIDQDSLRGVVPLDEMGLPVEPLKAWITSPLVGTFYLSAGDGAPPLASQGTEVQPATVVGIVEALNVVTEVEAGCAGVIVEVLASDGQPVEYGQRLFEVEPRA